MIPPSYRPILADCKKSSQRIDNTRGIPRVSLEIQYVVLIGFDVDPSALEHRVLPKWPDPLQSAHELPETSQRTLH